MAEINVALAQLTCEDGLVEKNLQCLDETVKHYGDSHDLILFPEAYIMGFPPREIIQAIAQPLNGSIVKHLEHQAREANTAICVGLYERDGEKIYNTTVLVDKSGLLLSYRKTHLWVGEFNYVDSGNCFRSCNWRETHIGLLICYDVEFPETARALAGNGAELLLLTNGNMAPYESVHRVAIQARAQENQIFVAMANRVGQSGSDIFVGHSIVVDPYGRIVAEAGDSEEVLSVSIDLALVQESREVYHYLKERRVQIATIPGAAGPNVRESRI